MKLKQELITKKKELPEGWKFVRLGSILEMNYGKGLAIAEREKGEIPVYGSNGVIGFNNDCLIDFNTIIIGRKGSAGELNFVERPCWPIDTTYYVATRYNLKFIYYLLKHIDLKKITQKGAKPGLNREEAYDLITIFTEDETEQQKIVSKLDKQMEQIEMMKKEVEDSRDSYEMMIDSLLNDNLDNLLTHKTKKLSELVDVRDGTHDTPIYVKKGISFITSKNLKYGKIDFDNVSHISEEDHVNFSKRSYVEKGDILFGMIGTIGNPVIVETSDDFSIKNVALLKINNSPMINKYILILLNSKIIKNQFERKKKGGIQKFVSLKIIRNLNIPNINREKQKEIIYFYETIKTIMNEIRHYSRNQILAISQLPSSILNEVFGQYEIPEEI